MKKMTISQAAMEAIRKNGIALSAHEIYEYITRHNLYVFKAVSPESVLKAELRKHTLGNTNKNSAETKYFKLTKENKYEVIS